MSEASTAKAAKELASKRSECVKVVVRVRPLFGPEIKDNRVAVTTAHEGEIRIRNPKADEREMPKVFTFDATYGPDATQSFIYETTAAPIVDSVMQGYNGTIFAYGQTGAGKTHTMQGKEDPPELRGIIPNSFRDIFHKISLNTEDTTQFLVRASYLEIYNEEVRDLLAKNPLNRLELKESVDSGVFVKDLTMFVVKSAAEIDTLMKAGNKNRSTGATKMNQTSSRSHSIFTITVETSEIREDGEAHIRVGKLNMVDLAGSERQSKTGATGQRLKEATKINLSLSALGNVISALVDSKSQHIPYRDSKLTRLLQDSLGGNTKTVMIANCGPADYNYDETLSTLRYASRAKQIKNKPKINEDPKDAMLREFQEEIERLRRELATKGEGGGGGAAAGAGGGGHTREVVVEERVVHKGVSEEEVAAMKEQAEKEKEALLKATDAEREALRKKNKETEEQRKKLEAELEAQEAEKARIAKEQEAMEAKLKAMQEKVLAGGQLQDKAAQKEEDLRRAQIELEERKRQESALARELEEANMMIEEQYNSMQEEVEVKTKKLKKVWQKWQQANTEIKDLQKEFQSDKEDMLETIRELQRELKLKQLVIDNFIPPDEVRRVEARATWDDEAGDYAMPRLELSGNAIRAPRPQSDSRRRRPESEYARRRATYDTNPRYKPDDVAQLELDMPERTTQDIDGAAMSHKMQAAIDAALVEEEDDTVVRASGSHHKHKSRSKEKKSRPGTASRRRRGEGGGGGGGGGSSYDMLAGGDGGGGREAYPSARGLVSRD